MWITKNTRENTFKLYNTDCVKVSCDIGHISSRWRDLNLCNLLKCLQTFHWFQYIIVCFSCICWSIVCVAWYNSIIDSILQESIWIHRYGYNKWIRFRSDAYKYVQLKAFLPPFYINSQFASPYYDANSTQKMHIVSFPSSSCDDRLLCTFYP